MSSEPIPLNSILLFGILCILVLFIVFYKVPEPILKLNTMACPETQERVSRLSRNFYFLSLDYIDQHSFLKQVNSNLSFECRKLVIERVEDLAKSTPYNPQNQ
jgi:hypothetical protein